MKIEVEDKSLHLALLKATIKLGASHEDLDYEVLEKQSGFLGLFCKKRISTLILRKTPYNSDMSCLLMCVQALLYTLYAGIRKTNDKKI